MLKSRADPEEGALGESATPVGKNNIKHFSIEIYVSSLMYKIKCL